MSPRNRWTTALLGLVILALAACQQRAAYSHYEPVSLNGWNREDTVKFTFGPVTESNSFRKTLGLRASLDYPFTNLSLIVEQEVMPSGTVKCDTLDISLIDIDGSPKGKGVNHYQYDIPLNSISLLAGETLYVSIRHNMKRENLPGISDIGLTLEGQP